MTRKSTFGALVFTVLLITTGLSGAVGANPTADGAADASPAPLAQETTTAQGNESANESASVTFTDQRTNGSVVTVNQTNLSAGGYVVVFAQNGTVLGNTSYLEPGTHENLTIPLDTGINASQVVIAAPHLDTDGDQTFGFNATNAQQVGVENATDRPYLQENGLPISQVAFVIVGNETRRGTTTTASRVAPSA
ncbi:hypothetical protein M0R89_18900 (plasmid) [Halorussus limi]|uniref:DUF7282 domain-containing protein n=1 Tax=Halorussus limi TaxID=2938695 RepID=A0A8U0I0Q7_9EURY|nr:hypothetical protein [Halorussus limi]UPV76603.1 hypothetical protein M0R89_18900 [Halorussus limi]